MATSNDALVRALALIEKQTEVIADLAKSLAIAHEHHTTQAGAAQIQPYPFPIDDDGDSPRPRLWMTEEEEDRAFLEGGSEQVTRESVLDLGKEILEAAGIDPTTLTIDQ